MAAKPEGIFDRRIASRNIERGKITQKEYDNFIKRLPDVSKKAVPLFDEEEEQRPTRGETADAED